jgi:hypothetical protein
MSRLAANLKIVPGNSASPKVFLFLLVFSFLGLALVSRPLQAAPKTESRLKQPDVVYLEEFLKQPLNLKAIQTTPITFTRDGHGPIDVVRPGQHVRVIGLWDRKYLVNSWGSTGRVEGWVVASDFEPFPEEVLALLRKRFEEAQRIEQAIESGEIVIGLPDEAVEKILGKPTAKSTIVEAGGKFEQWTYTAFKSIPYYVPAVVNGTNVVTKFYRKIPVGYKIVTFQDHKVIRFETKEESAASIHNRGETVIPPVYVQ